MTDVPPGYRNPPGWGQPENPYGQVPVHGYATPPPVMPPPTHWQPAPEPLSSPNFAIWWSRGMDIVKRGWKPLAALQAAGVLVTLLVQAPLLAYVAITQRELLETAATPDSVTAPDPWLFFMPAGLGALAGVAGLIVAALVTLASVHVGASVGTGAPVRINEAFRLAGRRLFPMLGWQLLAIPIYLVALCLCFFPIFYIAAVFLVLPVVVAVERTNVISRCFSLFHRDLGTSIARVATIGGLLLGVSLVGALLGNVLNVVLTSAIPGTAGVVSGSLVGTLLTATIGAAVAVLVAPLTLLTYVDMRVRTDPPGGPTIAQQLGIVRPAAPATSWPAGPSAS